MIGPNFFAFAGLLAILAGAVPAQAQSVSLVGSVRTASGSPISGATVFVALARDSNNNPVHGAEVGPVGTSGSGVFAFYNLPPGTYTVTISVSGVTLWRGSAQVPGRLAPIVLH